MVAMTEAQFLLNRIVYWAIGLILGLCVSAYILMAKDFARAWKMVRAGEAEAAASETSEETQ